MDELPAPLQPLGQYRQFVTYRLVPSARAGKMDKLPCDWRTGDIANAQAPATWGTFENCRDAVRADAAAVAEVFANVMLIADPAMLKGRRYGNVILLASDAPLPVEGSDDAARLARQLLGGAVPFGARYAGAVGGVAAVDPYADFGAQFSRFWFSADHLTDGGDKIKAYIEERKKA